MKRIMIAATATLVLSAAALVAPAVSTPATAAPALSTQVAGDAGVTQARYHGRRHFRRHRMMRPRRAYAPSKAGNARNPSRPPMMQNQGGTSGGYR